MARKDIEREKYERALIAQITPGCDVFLKVGAKKVLDKREYRILRTIQRTKSLKETSNLLNMSYRGCQNHISRIEEKLGTKVVATLRGGVDGGGGADLTDFGRELVKIYASFREKANINLQSRK